MEGGERKGGEGWRERRGRGEKDGGRGEEGGMEGEKGEERRENQGTKADK